MQAQLVRAAHRAHAARRSCARRSPLHRIGLQGRIHIGGQDQFYLEGMIAYAVPKEDGTMLVYSSTQHPGEVQHQVAHALDVDANDVVVDCRRMGGGFGGKESQPGLFACVAALFAQKTQAPGEAPRRPRRRHADHRQAPRFRHRLRSRLRRRRAHPRRRRSRSRAAAAIRPTSPGRSTTARCSTATTAITSRTSASLRYRCKTNTQSNTAFRGFGGPQGMVGIEQRDRRHRAPPRRRPARRAQGSTSTARPSATSRTTTRRSSTT